MQTLRRTPLYEKHVELGARLVPFAGWEMPVQYEGVIAEHKAVRSDAGVFDVSHMGEIEVEGPTARDLLQATLSNDIDRLEPGEAQYTLLTTESGGIVDDLIVYRLDAHRYLLVVNASNREAAFEWLRERELRGSDVRDVSDDYALLAVQGPRALDRIGIAARQAVHVGDGRGRRRRGDDQPHRLYRRGGRRARVHGGRRRDLWDAVVARGVTPCGLGARDTLRLEVCYPLHGNDIGPQWDAISSRARLGVRARHRVHRRRAAARDQGRRARSRSWSPSRCQQGIPRQGMPIEDGGEVTSGTMSPMLDVGIGLGYVPASRSATGTELTIDVRGRPRAAQVVKKPFYTREEKA